MQPACVPAFQRPILHPEMQAGPQHCCLSISWHQLNGASGQLPLLLLGCEQFGGEGVAADQVSALAIRAIHVLESASVSGVFVVAAAVLPGLVVGVVDAISIATTATHTGWNGSDNQPAVMPLQ